MWDESTKPGRSKEEGKTQLRGHEDVRLTTQPIVE
jgi:hypothetical protein